MLEIVYPRNIKFAVGSLDLVEINQEMNCAHGISYFDYCHRFLSLAKNAHENKNFSGVKAYYLLAYICSLQFDSDSKNFEIKKSYYEFWDSTLLAGLQEDELNFLTKLLPVVDNIYLKARVADILWTSYRPKNLDYARIAIETYTSLPIKSEHWWFEGHKLWQRAIALSISLGKTTQDLYTKIEELFRDYFLAPTSSKDGIILTTIFAILDKFNIAKVHYTLFVNKLILCAEIDYKKKEFFHASTLYGYASKCYYKLQLPHKEALMKFKEAMCYEENAKTRRESIVKKHFYELAYKTLITIPKKHRSTVRDYKKIKKLQTLIEESGSAITEEFVTVALPSIDLTDLVAESEATIRNLSLSKALNIFLNSNSVKLDSVLRIAKDTFKISTALQIVSPSFIASDGHNMRLNQGFQKLLEVDEKLYTQIVSSYDISIGVFVNGDIIPSLEVLHNEQNITTLTIAHIVNQSPIVPTGREQFFIEGIFAGYNGNYAVALHLLVPQVENIIRLELKKLGASTVTIATSGEENENSLSTLLTMPEVNQLGDETFVFELRTLLCEHTYTNFRNTLAHGLVNYDDLNSHTAVYAWWFIFRMVFNSFKEKLLAEAKTQIQQSTTPNTS